MNKVWYTNESSKFLHIGSVTIPPGETREVDASLVPGEKPADEAKQPSPGIDPIAELLKKKVADIVAELETLSDEDLAKAAALEAEGQARKSLAEAFAAETLRRAQLKAGGQGGSE